MRRDNTEPMKYANSTAYDPKSGRPNPDSCLHQRDKYTAWGTVGLTTICSLCLRERCTICHRNMDGVHYAKHQNSNCGNR